MKKLTFQIGILAAALLAVCLIWRLCAGDTYRIWIPVGSPGQAPAEPSGGEAGESGPALGKIRFSTEDKEIAEFGEADIHNGYVSVPVRPEQPGRAFYEIQVDGEVQNYLDLRVGRFRTVYNKNTGGFTGDAVVLGAVTAFFLIVSFLLFRYFLKMSGCALYSYYTIYTSGFSLFTGMTGVLLLYILIRHLRYPQDFVMREVYETLTGSAGAFMQLTLPLIVAFSLLLIVSNAELLRHERPRPQNLLGIMCGIVLLAGEGIGLYLDMRNFSGSIHEFRVYNTLRNVYCTAYVYFECMLTGAVICALRAVFHKPAQDKDYIIILGCRFRRDGTLTPLLQGRCDRAIAFWHEQKARTGQEAVLVPSGGQGPDESMPEAEAMARYLLSRGIPEHAVRKEDRSRNTYQNMAFSKELIEKENKNPRVVYATTNYHVFRSGVWAGLAGLRAEGIGSRTRWWFWPNAFLRECAGLLCNRIPQEAALFAALTLFFCLLSVALE